MTSEIRRGEVWWADLDEPDGSSPGYTRPVVVVQSDAYNRSGIGTTIVVAFSSNLRLAHAPGNVLVKKGVGGLVQDSVANVSHLLTADRTQLNHRMGTLPPEALLRIEGGLVRVLGLGRLTIPLNKSTGPSSI